MRSLPTRLAHARLAGLVAFVLFASASSAHADRWTVLAYMAADNPLDPYAVENIEEMASAQRADVQVALQIDRGPPIADNPQYVKPPIPGIGVFEGTRRLVVRDKQLEQVADLGDPDGTLPETIADFIQWGVQSYPADHYVLVLWGVGAGWRGAITDESGGGDGLLAPLDTIADGIEQGLKAAGLAKLTLLGLDQCVMATLEVADTMSAYADVMVASEELEPGGGWDYSAWLDALGKDSAMAPAELGRTIASSYAAKFGSTRQDITLAVLDLAAVPALTDAVRQLAIALLPPLADRDGWLAVARARAEADHFGGAEPAEYDLVDLGMFADALAANLPPLTPQVERLDHALAAVVLYDVAGDLHAHARGLSIHVPERDIRPKYLNLRFADDSQWGAVVSAYAAQAAKDTTAPVLTTQSMSPALSAKGLTTVAHSADADVSQTNLVITSKHPDGDERLLAALPASHTSEGVLRAGWDERLPVLTDARGDAEVSFLSVASHGLPHDPVVTLAVPIEFEVYGSNAPALLVFRYDRQTGQGRLLWAYLTEGALELDVQHAFLDARPMLVKLHASGALKTSPGDRMLDLRTLALRSRMVDRREPISVGLLVHDYAGNSALQLAPAGVHARGRAASSCSLGAPSRTSDWRAIVQVLAVGVALRKVRQNRARNRRCSALWNA